VLTDPAATARVPATTAQRVLEKNAQTVMVFPVMDSLVRSVEIVLQQVVGIVRRMATAHHVLIAPIVQDMQTVVSEESVLLTVTALSVASVLRMEIVPSEVTALHMVTAQTGANAPVTVIVMLHLAVIVHVMETVTVLPEASVPHTATAMARLVAIVPIAQQVTVPHMATVATEMRVQNAVVLVEVALAEHHVVNVLVEIVEASPHLETGMHAQNALSVLPMAIALSAESVLRMATKARVQNVAVIVLLMVIVRNAEIDLLMAAAMVRLVVIVQAMAIVGPNRTVGENALHTVTAVPVRNVQNAPAMVTANSVVIVPPMETVAHVQTAVVIVLPMVNV
jgi:hypothetical protein